MAKGKYQEWLQPDNLLRMKAWARDGLTDENIADKMGIAVSTLYDWKNKHPDISEALKKGKEVVDIEVEDALHSRAVGCKVVETIEERQLNLETGKYEMVITKRITKELPPDVTAIIYWTKNRQPEKWRDAKRVDMKADVNNPFDGITTEELEKIRDALK